MWRRRSRVMAAAAVLVVGAGGVVAYGWWTGFGSGLERPGVETLGYCYAAPTPEELAARATVGTTFGMDQVSLTSDTAVRVVSVAALTPTGGLELVRSTFVPGAEVGGGSAGDRPFQTATRVLASMARSAPTTLTTTPRPATEQADNSWSPRAWQLVVTVRAPIGSVDASAAGFVVTYRRGHGLATVTTQDTVRIVNTPHGCSSSAGGASPSPARSAVGA